MFWNKVKFVRVLFRLVKASELSLKKYIFIYIWCMFCAIAYTRNTENSIYSSHLTEQANIYYG